jgi:tetratricopeptide (TPR) repeat protein
MSQLLDYSSLDPWEIRTALAKILADAEFQRNANSAHFLSFVIEETLTGRGDRLKGFTIATSALGRKLDFDPSSSAAVRVQANRLRHLLSDYYLGPGSRDPVRIVLPLGSYRPQFERRALAAALPAEDRAKAKWSWRGGAGLASWRFAACAVVVCLAVAGAALLIRSFPPTEIAVQNRPSAAAPVVVVESANDVDATNDAKDAANLVVIALESELSVFDHFVVERRADSTGRDRPDYALFVSAGPSSGAVNDFTFQLVYLPTNEIVWARTFAGVNLGAQASIDGMTQAVVSAVGELRMGAIMADQRRRAAVSKAPLQGYACLVAVYDYILNRRSERRGPARECPERELSLSPRDPHALTLLSVILIDDYINLLPGNQGLADIERAATLAQLAFEILPFRSETSTNLFLSRFYSRRFDDAFGIAPQLLANTPNSRLLAANVGDAYIARGRYDEGMAILPQLEMANLGAPPISVSMLALAAHMRGDEETAERFAGQAAAARQPMGFVVRIAACETENNQVCVLEASQQLHQNYPGFAADVRTALFRHALADDIRAKLLADLRAAGFFAEASR